MIVRRADKSNIFVVMDKSEYYSKINSILQDTSKFQFITRNPTLQLETEMNKLIATANHNSSIKIFKPIVGEYSPGYTYSTIKIHKEGNPLRPIISQVATPVYETAKQLDKIISLYLLAKYQINSTDEFLHLLRAPKLRVLIGSIDSESLFSNVPLHRTLDIICNAVYNHSRIPPPSSNESTLP